MPSSEQLGAALLIAGPALVFSLVAAAAEFVRLARLARATSPSPARRATR